MATALEVECKQCGKALKASKDCKRFVFCGCSNKVGIRMVSPALESHWISATDTSAARVHVLDQKGTKLFSLTLKQWDTYKTDFRTKGTLL
jgi:hypothetical protein